MLYLGYAWRHGSIHHLLTPFKLRLVAHAQYSTKNGNGKQVKAILDQIKGREWGLMILDEVHVAPAR